MLNASLMPLNLEDKIPKNIFNFFSDTLNALNIAFDFHR